MKTLSVIIPAHNEAALISRCLEALLSSDPLGAGWEIEVLVVANGCTDTTAALALDFQAVSTVRGWSLNVIEEAKGDKLNALNVADARAKGDIRVYLDADVTISPALLVRLQQALDTDAPMYASGQPQVSAAQTPITEWYGRFWATLPFMTSGVPGFGVFAMNAKGRARWGAWPDIISDDTFARLNFVASERALISASYSWPMVEGFANLVRVRRRQNDGVAEIARLFPNLPGNDDKPRLSLPGLVSRAIRDPLGFAAYGAVSLVVKSPLLRSDNRWARGR